MDDAGLRRKLAALQRLAHHPSTPPAEAQLAAQRAADIERRLSAAAPPKPAAPPVEPTIWLWQQSGYTTTAATGSVTYMNITFQGTQ